jgi:hypothetical protein
MIPSNITREHIRQAAAKIDKEGVPPGRKSRKYQVWVDDKPYPPPLIVCWANKFANGIELQPFEISAQEALRYLKGLGFQIEPIREDS